MPGGEWLPLGTPHAGVADACVEQDGRRARPGELMVHHGGTVSHTGRAFRGP
jgi:hypothetical protein